MATTPDSEKSNDDPFLRRRKVQHKVILRMLTDLNELPEPEKEAAPESELIDISSSDEDEHSQG